MIRSSPRFSFAKKVLTLSAGLLLAGQTTFAQVNPLDMPSQPAPRQQQPQADDTMNTRHVGEIEGTPVVLLMEIVGTRVRGTLLIGSLRCPIQGNIEGNTINGQWVSDSGKVHKLSILPGQGKLVLHTNGKEVALSPAPNRNAEPAPQPEPRRPINVQPVSNDGPINDGPINDRPANNGEFNRPAPAANELTSAPVVSGKHFSTPLPKNWRGVENPGAVSVISPDGKTAYGVLGSNTKARTAEAFLRETFEEQFKVRDFTILNSKQFKGERGEDGLVAMVKFVGGDGVSRSGFMKAMLTVGNDANFGFLVHTASDRFDVVGDDLVKLAMQIRVLPQEQADRQPVRNDPPAVTPRNNDGWQTERF